MECALFVFWSRTFSISLTFCILPSNSLLMAAACSSAESNCAIIGYLIPSTLILKKNKFVCLFLKIRAFWFLKETSEITEHCQNTYVYYKKILHFSSSDLNSIRLKSNNKILLPVLTEKRI